MNSNRRGADSTLLQQAWSATALRDDVALESSNYCAYHDGELFHLLDSSEPSPFTRIAHDAFRSFIEQDNYPCLAARAAVHRSSYRIGAYAQLADERVTRGLLRDMHAFVTERRGLDTHFTTYAAIFREQVPGGEEGFEKALWSQLQRLHELDSKFYAWDSRVGSHPHSADFSFSVGGEAFFVIGLHPNAEREARRFPWPALIFNAHEQFEELKDDGLFDNLQRQIRARDMKLQGDINPNLANYGEESESRQYSGRKVGADWKCPFRPN
jgi:FPC/CPF motif-containing protein YcgG